ncbi:MAG: YajQ family cyclic di-GMP-binding protein [Dehalococcoidia bacterium]|nr:MAG: YajQ family cyclic di-GMP-binding protein [Dehalococcoidia bacterium]
MAGTESFDVTSGVDLQEVDNAVNQAKKEIAQRYDFKGQKAEIEYDRKAAKLELHASDEYYLNAMWQVIRERMISRQVPIKNLQRGKVEPASGGTVRQEVNLQQGIPQETCRAIVKLIKEQKLKKVQSQIQGDAVRISSPSRDELQGVIALLRQQDYDVELKFGNYR